MSATPVSVAVPICLRDSRLGDARDLALVRHLFENNGFPRTMSEVAWIYQPIDGVGSFATIGMDGDRIAALYAAVPVRFQIGSLVHVGAQSLDTMVDKDYRGLGLFTKMAKATYSLMAESNVCLVYGFPNGNSYHGFTKKLAWTSLNPVPFLFRPLNLGYLAARVNPRLGSLLGMSVPVFGVKGRSEKMSRLPEPTEVDELWNDFKANIKVGRVRDYMFLHTRYESHPRAVYTYRSYREDGKLLGLSIHCVEKKHGGTIGYLMELMCATGRDDVAKSLICDVLSDMKTAGCDGVLAWCFAHSPYYRQLLASLFLPLPVSLRPIELHFGCLPLKNQDPDLMDRRNWYVSYGDSDTV